MLGRRVRPLIFERTQEPGRQACQREFLPKDSRWTSLKNAQPIGPPKKPSPRPDPNVRRSIVKSFMESS